MSWRRLTSLACCVVINGQVWGHAYSYHVVYLRLSSDSPHQAVHASLLGSLTFGCVMFFSVLLPPLMRRVPLPLLYACACGLGIAGPALSSLTSDLRVWYATWVLPLSLSGATFFTLGFCVATQLFPRHAYIVCALVSGSVGFFSLLLPLAWHAALHGLGLSRTLLIYSATFAAMLPGAALMPRRYGTRDEAASGWRSVCQRDLLLWTGGLLLAGVMFYCPFVHVMRLAHEALAKSSYTAEAITGAVCAVLSTGSVFSKALMAALCHRRLVRGLLLFQLSLLCFGASQIGLALLLYLPSPSFALLLLLCFLMGAGEGPYFSLMLPVTSEVSHSSADPTIFTFVCSVIAFPLVLGGPIGERLYSRTGGYVIPFLLTGTAFFAAANVMLLIRRQALKREVEVVMAALQDQLEEEEEGRVARQMEE